MAEEQRMQEGGGHRLCSNNCGFFGSPTTLNLCSKCYKNYCMKEQQSRTAQLAMEKTRPQQQQQQQLQSESTSTYMPRTKPPSPIDRENSETATTETARDDHQEVQLDDATAEVSDQVQLNNITADDETPDQAQLSSTTTTTAAPDQARRHHQVESNRCATCRKRVGLTGFKCRCGVTFCGSHRYPEHHGCTFDYKSMGKVAIAMANPLVKAEKLHKI